MASKSSGDEPSRLQSAARPVLSSPRSIFNGSSSPTTSLAKKSYAPANERSLFLREPLQFDSIDSKRSRIRLPFHTASASISSSRRVCAETLAEIYKCAQQRALQKRAENFPPADTQVWNRKKHKGFTSIPRTLQYIMQAIDALCKNAPPSAAYFVLWCMSFEVHLM